ncbi:unnamed protein product [Spirodela intermedia]|uniref:Uncharacterized protein n=1 Tax=Spirodela intermedia TaxID=51605 RepID=A0A7I8JT85_SPIIN|nr:unnamed protein product [Spirodela intermedia]CAA6673386.1 unnamed protein product [Spirodela intermedia]
MYLRKHSKVNFLSSVIFCDFRISLELVIYIF